MPQAISPAREARRGVCSPARSASSLAILLQTPIGGASDAGRPSLLATWTAPRPQSPRRLVAVVRIEGQDDNDLAKAVAYCRRKRWKNPVILGACGKREDHAIGNVFRALEFGLEIVTGSGRFVPVCGRKTFRVRPGTAVSVFAPDSTTRMTSRGLEWPLDGVRFQNLYCATLNRATSSRVALTANRPVSVFICQ